MSRHAVIALTTRLGPMSVKQIAAELRVQDSTMRTCISRARAHGTKYIRIAAWAGSIALYGPGPEPDAEGGSTGDRIMQLMTGGERATVRRMADLLGLPMSVVDPAVRRLREKPGKLHIVGWERRTGGTGGREAPIFMSGPGKDAPRPDFASARREAELRYNERRRIKHALNGGKSRPRAAKAGPSSGYFDGLLR